MESRLVVVRELPDGRLARVMPFHISLEGLDSELICRDEKDYDMMVKHIFLCARKQNLLVIIYAVVSNHAHIAVLGENKEIAEKYSSDLKKRHSMWLRSRYGAYKVLRDSESYIAAIDTLPYARNVLAYIPRNAIDNFVGNISDYKWTGFRGMFCNGEIKVGKILVSSLSKSKQRTLFHTKDSLDDVQWYINEDGQLEPASTCDWKYLERIYNHDQSYFLKMIGLVNVNEMEYGISVAKSIKMTDSEFLKTADEYAVRWYGSEVSRLSPALKAKMLGYLKRILRLSVPQVARCFGMDRDAVHSILGHKMIKEKDLPERNL